MSKTIMQLLHHHGKLLSGGFTTNPFAESLQHEVEDDIASLEITIEEEPCMERTTPNPNPTPFAHRPMKTAGRFRRVPNPSSLEEVDPSNKEKQDATLVSPALIVTPFQLIDYIAEMMKFRDLEKYPNAPFNVIREVWDDNVNALDHYVRDGLGLSPDSEEGRIIYSSLLLLDRRKLQDQLPMSTIWNNDYQYHWIEMRDIIQAYLNRYQQ